MLFDAMTKIKRQSIIISILLMCLGMVLIVCPEEYVSALIMLAGYIMIIYAMEQSLEYIVGRGSLIQSISFIIAVFIGLIGLAVLVFHENILNVLSWIFGVILLLEGGNDLHYSFTFARRSGRSGWSILVIFALVLIASGVGLVTGGMYVSHAAFQSPVYLMRLIGVALLAAALISALKILWIKPAKDGGNKDE